MIKRYRPSPGTVLGFLALAAASGGLAIAALSTSNLVHGCVDKHTGLLRVLHRGQHCSGHETKLDFNKQGPRGAGGAAVVLRARGRGNVVTKSCTGSSCTPYPSQVYPVHPVSWTQAATEDDQLFGQATITSTGASCSSGFPSFFAGQVAVVVDRKPVSFGTIIASSSPGTSTVTISPATLFEPGRSVHHTLSVRISDNCNTGTHYVIDSVKLDVAAMR